MKRSILSLEWWSILGALALVLLVAFSQRLDYFDDLLLDAHYQTLRHLLTVETSSEVVIVGIDDQTLEQYPEPLALWHERLGRFFSALASAKPRAVVVDLILPERSYDTLVAGLDRKLMMGLLNLKRATKVVLARTVDQSGNMRPLHAPLRSLMGETQFALALVRPDDDRTVRLLTTRLTTPAGEFVTLAGRLYDLELEPTGTAYINYLIGAAFDYTSMQDVVNMSNDDRTRLFEDKIIVVGSVLPFTDRHRAPLPLAAWEPGSLDVPGMLLHAQQIRTLLKESPITPVGGPLVLLLSMSTLLIWWIGRRSRWVVLTGLALTASLFISSGWLLYSWQLWLSPALILFSLLVFSTARVSVTAFLDWREKRQLRAAFSGVVSPQVMNDLLRGRIGRQLGNQRREICVMFADINQFTTRSEQQTPDAMIEMLNRYFGEMSDVIHGYDGTVDKFIGDGLMAFFGAPNTLDECCQSAFDAARDMLYRLDLLNGEFASAGIDPISIKIGLHFGWAAIGHVGSDTRNEYTAIGDTVNVAARLEGFAKKTDYDIVCSASVADNLTDELVNLGQQPLKGHSDMQVFGWQKEASSRS